jgi:uncharacterized membrane protein YhhN
LLIGLVDPAMLSPIHGVTIAWKGMGVGLLALWALLHGRGRDGLLLAAVMAFGALGDVLLDAVGLALGALAFAIGHLLAIWLYARNRRMSLTVSQRALAILVVPLSLLLTWLMVRAAHDGWQAIVYTGFVAVMAAMAWTSRFPRYVTGIGAMMFLTSDLIIFARESGSVPVWVGAALIWPLYMLGQALIARGVLQTLDRDRAG